MRHAFFSVAFLCAVQAKQLLDGACEGYAARAGDKGDDKVGAVLGSRQQTFIKSRIVRAHAPIAELDALLAGAGDPESTS